MADIKGKGPARLNRAKFILLKGWIHKDLGIHGTMSAKQFGVTDTTKQGHGQVHSSV